LERELTLNELPIKIYILHDQLASVRAQLREKIEYAVSNAIITVEMGELANQRLLPLSEVFNPTTGTYRWDKPKFEIQITEQWKVRNYGYPLIYQNAVRAKIREMLNQNIIVVMDTPYVHPIVIKPKSNGEIRICLDASGLNKVLTKVHHDPRKIENILFEESTGALYSLFDFSQGFHQIELDKSASYFLGFQIDGVTYAYKKLPFGTAVSSAIFIKAVKQVVYEGKPPSSFYDNHRDEPSVIEQMNNTLPVQSVNITERDVRCYVDDLLLSTNSFEEHLTIMEQLFKNIIASGMTLKIEKLKLFVRDVEFLGHILHSSGCITKKMNKQEYFEEFERENIHDGKIGFKKKKAVQKFVGFFNWFARFIPKYGDLIEPFIQLLGQSPPFKASRNLTENYYQLKDYFLRDLPLMQPNYSRPLNILFSLREGHMSGAICQRDSEGRLGVIIFFNAKYPDTVLTKINDIKKYYSLYFVLHRFKDLLFGRRILIEKEVSRIVQYYREAVEFSKPLAKWYIVINSFEIDSMSEGDEKFNDLINDIEKHCKRPQLTSIDTSGPMEGICMARPQTIRGVDESLSKELYDIICSIEQHQRNDKYCERIMRDVSRNLSVNKFIIREDCLYKFTKDGFELLVLPSHCAKELAKFYHLAYCHSGVEKTILVIKRQFYFKGIDNIVRQVVGECIECKYNKINNRQIEVEPKPIIARKVGEILSIDVFGPLPARSKLAVSAVFVSMDRLSGYVHYEPLRSMKTEALLRALKRTLDHFSNLEINVFSVLSDNAPQFRSNKWASYLRSINIRNRHTTPYSAWANPVERANRCLGEKLRLRINSKDHSANDHTKWCSELKFIEDTLNSLPKHHTYSPNQIVGIREVSRDPTGQVPICCPDPGVLALKRRDELTFETRTWTRPKNTTVKLPFDETGTITVYCDGAASTSPEGRQASSYAVWFASGHLANKAEIIWPGTKNNKAEIIAVIRAIEISRANKAKRIRVVTDSAYVVDRIDEGFEDDESAVRLSEYENGEEFHRLWDLIVECGRENIKIEHCHGHTVSFGNLEADYEAQQVLDEGKKWSELINMCDTTPMKELIECYVAVFNKIHATRKYHINAVSPKKVTTYENGDVIGIKAHGISQAYYGLSKKFLPRYSGEYIVKRNLGSNAYVVESLENPTKEVLVNVRQMILLRRGE
jgi:ribonuclease HI